MTMGMRFRRTLPLWAIAALAAGCATAAPGASSPTSPSMNDGVAPTAATTRPNDTASPPSTTVTMASPSAPDIATSAGARQRCLDAVSTLDRRLDEEGFEFPDEGPELSEAELQRTLLPAVEYVDGVAAPDERPALEVMPDYDVETIPILDLDLFVGSCFEFGFVDDNDDAGDNDDE
ncbi:MAG: hypothetical protein AAFY28_08450 [Actinomycetota bacterium]